MVNFLEVCSSGVLEEISLLSHQYPSRVHPSGVPERSEASIDGWVMGDGWVMDGWMDGRMGGQPKSKKIMYFQHFSKTIRYFFLVVSRPLRRVFKTFSEKNSKKMKIFKFVKKFRTTFFLGISLIF